MIIVKEFPSQQFQSKEELFKALRENKSTLIAQKKGINKEADSVFYFVGIENEKGEVSKAENVNTNNINKIKAKLVINTTNLIDSHGDMHVKGLWKKSIQEQKNTLLLQEHKMTFDHIISDNILVSTKDIKWSDLGYNYEGKTQALVFDAEITKDRNNFMFEQYSKGYVKEHSVGMRYVKLDLAINSDSKYDKEEKAIWDKYYPEVVNKEIADEHGYFWVVTEAKAIEGSAVVKGSNHATPTISIEAVNDDTSKEQTQITEPSIDTQKKKNYYSLLN